MVYEVAYFCLPVKFYCSNAGNFTSCFVHKCNLCEISVDSARNGDDVFENKAYGLMMEGHAGANSIKYMSASTFPGKWTLS